MYNENQLNSERFQFTLENCTTYLNISYNLLKYLMKNNEELLKILFKNHLIKKFLIINLFYNYLFTIKKKTPTSNNDLYPQINNEKY